MLQLEDELKKNSLSRFHLIYGEERYMVEYYQKSITKILAAPDDEMNCTTFQGKKATPQAINDVGQILPFMVPQRLIIVKDSGLFEKSSDMADFLETFPDTTYVVFSEKGIDKRNKLYKWIVKNGCVTECKPQTASMLKQWIAGYLDRFGKKISGKTAEYLIECVGTSMDILNNELSKLIGYVGDRREIKNEDIDDICSGLTLSDIFVMLDAIAGKQREKALSLYADWLLTKQEKPMSILYRFTYHINVLLQIKELAALGLNRYEMAKKIKIPEFTVSKYLTQAKQFTRKELISILERRVECEESRNKGKMDEQIAVEMFLIQVMTE